MNNRPILFLMLLLLFNKANAQDREKLFVQSIMSNDFTAAKSHFENIENVHMLKSDLHFFAALAYIKNNDMQTAMKQLEIAVEKGLVNTSIESVSLDTLRSFPEYKKIAKKLKKNKKRAVKELTRLQKRLTYTFNHISSATSIDLKMTPVKHQANRNTCSVFAATSIAEYLLKERLGQDVDLSESYNYYLAKHKALSSNFLKEAYLTVDGLAGYLALDGYSYGALMESQWPYEQNNWLTTNNEKCKKPNGVPSVECFTGLPPENLELIAETFKTIFIPFDKIGDYILNEKKPVLVNIWLFRNGMNMQTGALNIPPKGQEQLMGGHVVVLTGYDAVQEEYTFKNSWGEGWGDNGFGTMPKAYLEKHFEASKSIPFNLDASTEEKEYLAKVALGSSLLFN